jgi:CheY-like chemotaxis protein
MAFSTTDSAFDPHEAPTLRQDRERPSATPDGLLAMVVDDDEDARAIYCATLAHLGHRTVACASGHEAIEAARHHHPDVVLIDVAMPHLDGIRATRMLKDERPEVFVIVMTAYTDEPFFDAALAAGSDAFLCKPFNPYVLREILEAVKERKDPRIVKQCGCGRAFSRAQWRALPRIGTMGGSELRNCLCGSSLAYRLDPRRETD